MFGNLACLEVWDKGKLVLMKMGKGFRFLGYDFKGKYKGFIVNSKQTS